MRAVNHRFTLVLIIIMIILLAEFSLMLNILFTESFVVCENFKLPPGYKPTMYNPLLNHSYEEQEEFTDANKFLSPFIATGDLQPFDKGRDSKVGMFIILYSLTNKT